MANELIMNITAGETRIARLENGVVAELFIERDDEKQIVGNIYKGRVTRVLPGMQAAFVDIGLEKAAFLYVSDVIPDLFSDDDEDEDDDEDNENQAENQTKQNNPNNDSKNKNHRSSNRRRRNRKRGPLPKIENVLKEGQSLVVQIAKDPIRTKGARITCHISFPGRFVVFMPTVDHVGVSRRVGNYEERKRLKDLIHKHKPAKGGFIARTVSQGAKSDALAKDMQNLLAIWDKIAKKQEKSRTPSLIYEDDDLVLRSIRDLMSPEIDRLVVDSKEDYNKIMHFMDRFMPDLSNRVKLYTKEAPIFDVYGIETEINRALGKKVWLKSGGYLVIDQSEALTSIDVNTGRFVGRNNFEDTILQTNLEAAEEIAYQLKLRSIGGIIINDFIDMERFGNRQKVFRAMKNALRKDKVKTTITKVSELGLVEMTRKRTRDSLTKMLSETCFFCHGKGHVKTPLTVAFELFRELKRTQKYLRGKIITVSVHPRVSRVLFNEARERLEQIEKRLGRRIIIKPVESFHVEFFDISTKDDEK